STSRHAREGSAPRPATPDKGGAPGYSAGDGHFPRAAPVPRGSTDPNSGYVAIGPWRSSLVVVRGEFGDWLAHRLLFHCGPCQQFRGRAVRGDPKFSEPKAQRSRRRPRSAALAGFVRSRCPGGANAVLTARWVVG